MVKENESVWDGEFKIPWHEPAFSERMLAEHLNQDHDLASRSVSWIDKQVDWIHENLLRFRPSSVLDLGCGPGFYLHRLTKLSHTCHGIDFGPASIAYANEYNPDEFLTDFVLGDIRHVPLGESFDLAMILYGEFNVFPPFQWPSMLQRVVASLSEGGQFAVELQKVEAVREIGEAPAGDQEYACGLFSTKPHRCHTKNQWLEDEAVAIQTFTVTEIDSEETRIYKSTTKAWTNEELDKLLMEAGFQGVTRRTDWPCNTDSLELWVANLS